jgi:hypothetical protein
MTNRCGLQRLPVRGRHQARLAQGAGILAITAVPDPALDEPVGDHT